VRWNWSCISQTQIGLNIALRMKNLLLVETFNLHTSSQYILLRAIPSCCRFAKVCLRQVSLLLEYSPKLLTSPWMCCTRTAGEGVLMVNTTFTDLDSLACILHILKPALDCS
jgi:hypothetical protein